MAATLNLIITAKNPEFELRVHSVKPNTAILSVKGGVQTMDGEISIPLDSWNLDELKKFINFVMVD